MQEANRTDHKRNRSVHKANHSIQKVYQIELASGVVARSMVCTLPLELGYREFEILSTFVTSLFMNWFFHKFGNNGCVEVSGYWWFIFFFYRIGHENIAERFADVLIPSLVTVFVLLLFTSGVLILLVLYLKKKSSHPRSNKYRDKGNTKYQTYLSGNFTIKSQQDNN